MRFVQLHGAEAGSSGCAGGVFAALIEIGVHRCAPTQNDMREPVPEKTWEDFTAGMTADVAALRRTPMCCEFLADNDLNWILVSVQPLGPQGGCGSAVATIQVEYADCGCPDGETS